LRCAASSTISEENETAFYVMPISIVTINKLGLLNTSAVQYAPQCDLTGLAWMLRGRPAVEMATDSATVSTPSGGQLTFYRRAGRDTVDTVAAKRHEKLAVKRSYVRCINAVRSINLRLPIV
jgi:hypothetical protein